MGLLLSRSICMVQTIVRSLRFTLTGMIIPDRKTKKLLTDTLCYDKRCILKLKVNQESKHFHMVMKIHIISFYLFQSRYLIESYVWRF